MTTTTAYILGNNVCTDLIHPPDYFSLEVERRKKGFLRGISTEWADNIKPGAIIIAGENFGCGSSREVTAQVFKDRGVELVLAKNFARIFYRNMVNFGIQVCQYTDNQPWQPGSEVEVEFDRYNMLISAGDHKLSFLPPSPFVEKIIAAGGLIPAIDKIFA